jgi:hypothetical protein
MSLLFMYMLNRVSAAIWSLGMFYSEMYKDVNMSFETLDENTGS